MTSLHIFGRPEPKPRQVAIVGSRAYPRLDLVKAFVASLPAAPSIATTRPVV